MKMNKFFSVMAMSAVLVSAFSCDKPEDPKTDEGGDQPSLSAEAKITAFTAIIGESQIEGKIFDADKVVELPYLPAQFDALKNATAKIEVSKGATVSPDPSVAADYTVDGGVKYTVTAEDGKSTKVYTVELAAAQFQNKVEKVWEQTFGDMGVAQSKFLDCGVGFSGTNIVTHDCQVFDKDGKKIGTLNTTGLPTADQENFQLVCMSNDINGVLFASVGTTAEGTIPAKADDIKIGSIYAWLEGWEKPATIIVDGAADGAKNNFSKFFSVSGDVKNNFIVMHPTPVRGGTQMHHCRAFSNGNYTKPVWSPFNVGMPSNDGNWSQIVSATSGNTDGIFVIGDSNGTATEVNIGYAAYVRQGVAGKEDKPLYGTVLDDELVEKPEKPEQIKYQYGNYSAGHVRGFQFNGKDYVIVCSSGWPNAFVTIQPTDPNEDYLLRSQKFDTASPSPCSAFMIDPETGNGLIVVSIQPGYEMVRYDIVTEIM